MDTSLHITNGDFTTANLQQAQIQGEIITWREMLCEGKTLNHVGSETFWKTRFDFLQSSYKVSKRKFITYTLKEYRNLCNQKQQKEIVLWFDTNLSSQINMLAVISWLKRYRQGRKITLIQGGKLSKNNKEKKISELTLLQISNAFNTRVELTKDDIEYADYIWQLYCSDCPLRLEMAHELNLSVVFTNLRKAIKTHLLRFPSIKTGLNNLETNILETITKNQFKNKNQLINTLLREQQVYGFTDLQYQIKIEELKKLFTNFSSLEINKTGKAILNHQLNYYGKIRNDISFLGGTQKYNYLCINTTNKLLKIAS